MNRLKKLYADHKEKAKGVIIGAGLTSIATVFLIENTKRRRQLVKFEVINGSDLDFPSPDLLYVKHKDGEEGYYNITS